MILAETSLSFLGLGLRAPVTSWGVLLKEAQNVQTVGINPWLILPVFVVIVTVLAYNFLGDGLGIGGSPYLLIPDHLYPAAPPSSTPFEILKVLVLLVCRAR